MTGTAGHGEKTGSASGKDAVGRKTDRATVVRPGRTAREAAASSIRSKSLLPPAVEKKRSTLITIRTFSCSDDSRIFSWSLPNRAEAFQ